MNNVVRLTDVARSKMIDALREARASTLRFSLTSGGCYGFNYDLKPTSDAPSGTDEVVPLDDQRSLVVCGKSLLYLIGVRVDHTSDVMGSRFVFDNPNASGTCGCGKSFS